MLITEQVAVEVEGHRRGLVAEHLLDDLHFAAPAAHAGLSLRLWLVDGLDAAAPSTSSAQVMAAQ
jgi:hypothetical protein